MKERFEKIMEYAGVSPKKFAEILGIERSNVSHITSGRNKPSLPVVQKILKCFPDISAEWLLFGEGNMLKTNNPGATQSNASTSANAPSPTSDTAPSPTPTGFLQKETQQEATPQPTIVQPQPANVQISHTQPTATKPTTTQNVVQQKTVEPKDAQQAEPLATNHHNNIDQTATQRTKVDKPSTSNSAEIQNMLANGLIVLDHTTKTFTVYSPSM